MAETSMESSAWMRKHLEGAHPDLLRELLQGVVEQLVGAEAQAICGAEYGERSSGRVNARNRYRVRDSGGTLTSKFQ
jgi:transposase-like protein